METSLSDPVDRVSTKQSVLSDDVISQEHSRDDMPPRFSTRITKNNELDSNNHDLLRRMNHKTPGK